MKNGPETHPRLRRGSVVVVTALVALGLSALSLPAQTGGIPFRNPQASLQQATGPQATSAYSAQSTAVLGQPTSDLSGLEVVNKYPVPNTLTFSTDQSVFWTDNAFLTKYDTQSSFAYSGRLGVAYIPYSTRDWTPSISFQQQFIRYDSTSVLDFDAQTAAISSQYAIFKDKSLTWNSTYSLQRLYTDRLHLGEFYKESFFDNGLVYVKPILTSEQVFFVAAYDIGWRLTDPQLYSRIDNSILASIVYLPVPNVRIQGYVRPAVYAYTDNQEFNYTTEKLYYRSRTDYDISTGVIASYFPIKQISINANVSWTGNYSNIGDREYTDVTPSLGVSGSIGFW